MAKVLLKNAHVVIASNDISAQTKQVGITYSAQALDSTAMGDNTKKNAAGLFDWPVTLDLYQDWGVAGLDSILFPLVGTVVTVSVNPNGAGNSTSNPQFSGSALLESYEPISGQVGQLAMTKVSFKPAGDLARATS